MAFRDHFSGVASQYAAFRPTYPAELFTYLASLPARHDVAWDCATGNGQAAVSVAPYFARVVATDASAEQIANAAPIANAEFRVARADASGLDDDSVDLITVAQALHWFDLPAFFAEVRRVLRAGGALAVWGYGDATLDTPDLVRALRELYSVTIGPYWPPNREVIDSGYRSFDMPFDEIAPPRFTLSAEWTLAQLEGYIRTWSATQRYVAATGRDPVTPFISELREAWGDDGARHLVTWPLWLRVSMRNA